MSIRPRLRVFNSNDRIFEKKRREYMKSIKH